MKILIIGGTSSLGTALKTVLSECSEVITAGRKNCDIILNLGDPVSNIIFPGDIDVVIHTASHFGGKGADEITEAVTVNVLGTLKICQAATKAKAKHLILISSIFALLKANSSYYSSYALSKKQSEEVATFFCNAVSLPLTILRPSQIYGNIDNFSTRQPFLNLILEKARQGETVNIFGSHDAKINLIHINDLVKTIEKIAENKIEGVYSCMYPENTSYSQFAKAAFNAFGQNEKISFLTEKENIQDNIFEEDNSVYEKINFYPQVTLEEGIKGIANFRNTSA